MKELIDYLDTVSNLEQALDSSIEELRKARPVGKLPNSKTLRAARSVANVADGLAKAIKEYLIAEIEGIE